MKFFEKKRIIKTIILTLVFWVIFNFGFTYVKDCLNPPVLFFFGIEVIGDTPAEGFGRRMEKNGSMVFSMCPPNEYKGFPVPYTKYQLELFFVASILNLTIFFGFSFFVFWIIYKLSLRKKKL